MKLLLAADIFPPQSGGPATYIVALARALQERGVSVRIVSLNPQSDKTAVRCQLSAVGSHHKLFRYLEYLWLIFREAKKSDVLYAMGPVNAGVPGCIVSWVLQKPFVVKVVGDYAWEQGVQRFGVTDDIGAFQKKPAYGTVRLLQWTQSFVTRRAARVIVPCRYLKTLVEGWGVDGKRICVVYNAPDGARVAPVEKPASERWVVSAGRLVPWKGMRALIDVVHGLADSVLDVRLKIIGDGPERARLQTHVQNMQAGSRVEFLGALPHDQTLAYVAAADVFALNSGYEGLSHVLLEAVVQGVPVVASRSGGNPEFMPEDQLFSYNQRDEMCARILATLKNTKAISLPDVFTIVKMVDRTQEILNAVCRKS